MSLLLSSRTNTVISVCVCVCVCVCGMTSASVGTAYIIRSRGSICYERFKA